jgi:glycosyltransferase involved in cell wall biosynthesis
VPSLAEGFPLAILEAMACARPVVATPVGGVPEAITSGVNGLLVPADDSASLASALDSLVRDPARREAMATAARRSIELRFSVAGVASAVQQLYDSLLQEETASGETRVR